MSFHFKLEGLLRVRRLLEQQAQERLDQAVIRIRTLERNIEDGKQWMLNTATLRSSKKLLPAFELQFIESVLLKTKEAIASCETQKQAEEKRAGELRRLYLIARRERKTVETLRENALHAFQTEQLRREQLALDESFLGKLLYTRNNERPVPEDTNPEIDL